MVTREQGAVTAVTGREGGSLWMAYPGQQYMFQPMFHVPNVTWNSAPGSNSVGKFPNPRSVMRICKCSLIPTPERFMTPATTYLVASARAV